MIKPKYLIFSDLDGSLLDHDTYRFDAARPALGEVHRQNIPLVLCSSKTASEILDFRSALQNRHPFISENGAAVYLPEGYFRVEVAHNLTKDGYLVIELGTHYSELREVLGKIRAQTGYSIVGFGDLTVAEVERIADLSPSQAESAVQREYDEPFYFDSDPQASQLEKISALAAEHGVSLTQGSRFYHLIGGSHKGKAVRHLTRIYQREWQDTIATVGIGDTLNDLSLLESVNYPILIRKHAGGYEQEIVRRLEPKLAVGVGPEGWNRAVLDLLKRGTFLQEA